MTLQRRVRGRAPLSPPSCTPALRVLCDGTDYGRFRGRGHTLIDIYGIENLSVWTVVRALDTSRSELAMNHHVVTGDLLDQPADVIVNAWNRNVIPWWLLLPQGVSGAIKRRAGLAPFRELARHGPIPLGGAVLTGAGRLPYAGIIHVAGIDLLWRASEKSICDSVRNAVALANTRHFETIALPVIGAGSGGFEEQRALELIVRTLSELDCSGRATVVRYNANGEHAKSNS